MIKKIRNIIKNNIRTNSNLINVRRRANEIYKSKRNDEDKAHALRDLMKIIIKPIQTEHLRNAYLTKNHIRHSPLTNNSFGIKGNFLIDATSSSYKKVSFEEYIETDNCLVKNIELFPILNLASEIILPTPWQPSRLVNCLGSIGKGRFKGSFKQDYNHKTHYIYPLNITLVESGNHSLSQGIIRGEGTITPTKVYDYSQLVRLIEFDGHDWKHIETGQKLGKPRYFEFGVIWEISRLLLEVEDNYFH